MSTATEITKPDSSAQTLPSRVLSAKTLSELSASVDRRSSLAKRMLAMGFTPEYHVSFNVVMNGLVVLEHLPEADSLDKRDFVWLCHRVARAYKRSGRSMCLDSRRLCRDQEGHPSAEYRELQKRGCCGFWDERITNPKTGNSFWLGFNYGH